MTFLQGADMLHDALSFLRLYLNQQGDQGDQALPLTYQRITDELTQALMALEEAQQAQDWTLVADLMDYELKPRINQLASLGASLEAQEVQAP